MQMPVVVLSVANSMICNPPLPNFCARFKFLLRPIRKPAPDHLNGAFKCNRRRDQEMEMIGHKNKLMKKIAIGPVSEPILEKKPRPPLGLKQCTTFPSLRSHEVGLRVVGRVFARGFQNPPSAAKAAISTAALPARLKPCPFKALPYLAVPQKYRSQMPHCFETPKMFCAARFIPSTPPSSGGSRGTGSASRAGRGRLQDGTGR